MMYHTRLKGSHYDMGFRWGSRTLRFGKFILEQIPFPITEERVVYGQKCRPYYESWYPEILEEIRGIAEGQGIHTEMLEAVLFSMYCIMPENHCSCFAFQEGDHTVLARNSDFLTDIEKLYMNCIYSPDNGSYSFQGNTTAFVEMEDGINEKGLAIGLTSVYPKILGYGLNAGMLLRYGLERCSTADDFIDALKKLPIASSQTFTVVDRDNRAVVIECNAEKIEVQYLDGDIKYVSAVNSFHLKGMEAYRMEHVDDWNAEERYATIETAFEKRGNKEAIPFAMEVLGGDYGFICQYDRSTGKDTVWSVIYDTGGKKVYRCEGNPARKQFKEDGRLVFDRHS